MKKNNNAAAIIVGLMFGLPILLFLVIPIIASIFTGTNGILNIKNDDKYFRILSNDDNIDFDSELYSFASKNKIKLMIEHADDLEAIDMLESNPGGYDAVWLSNSTWLYMLNGVTMLNSKSLNINPIVFGIKKSKAQELGFVDKEVYNRDLVNAIKDKKLKYVMSSVTKTNTGLTAYLGFLNSLAGSPEILTEEMIRSKKVEEDLKSLFSGVERVSGTDDFLKEMFLNSNDYEAVIATESSLISINKQLVASNKEPLYLIYPVDGVSINDSPFAYIDNKQDKLETFNKIQAFLLSSESQDKLEKIGKRTWYGGIKANADANSFKKDWGIDTTKYLMPLKYPSKSVMDEAINLYIDVFRKPSATAFCLDYSGSMYGNGEEELEDAMDYILDYEKAKEEKIQFSEKDKIIVIPFGSSNKGTYESDGRSTSYLISTIRDFNPTGGTNIYGCAQSAIELLNKYDKNEYTKTVVLMTDGESNVGSIYDFRRFYGNNGNGIPVYSIMFGSARKGELEDIASTTNAKVFDGRKDLVGAFKEVRSYN